MVVTFVFRPFRNHRAAAIIGIAEDHFHGSCPDDVETVPVVAIAALLRWREIESRWAVQAIAHDVLL